MPHPTSAAPSGIPLWGMKRDATQGQVAPPRLRLGFLRCLRFRSAIMSFFQRAVGRRLCFPALYPVRPAIGKRFFRAFSEGIRNDPNWLDWLSRGPSAGTPLWSAVARRRFGSALSAPFLQPPPFERPKLTQNRKRRRATALQIQRRRRKRHALRQTRHSVSPAR